MDYKRLYRSNRDCMLGGVAGGLAQYFNVDPTLVRLAFVLMGFATAFFPVMLVYFVLWVVIPRDPTGN